MKCLRCGLPMKPQGKKKNTWICGNNHFHYEKDDKLKNA